MRIAFLAVLNGKYGDTKISAENLFSLPICVIMIITLGRGLAPAAYGILALSEAFVEQRRNR